MNSYEKEAQRIVSQIDLDLKVKKIYVHRPGSGIYQVQKITQQQDQTQIFKWMYQQSAEFFNAEHEALKLVRDFPRTPELERVYRGEVLALLKSYMPGKTIKELQDEKGKGNRIILPESVISSGVELVDLFHKRGICNLELVKRNLLINEGLTGFFDFDSCYFREDLEPEEFEAIRGGEREDLIKLLTSYTQQ